MSWCRAAGLEHGRCISRVLSAADLKSGRSAVARQSIPDSGRGEGHHEVMRCASRRSATAWACPKSAITLATRRYPARNSVLAPRKTTWRLSSGTSTASSPGSGWACSSESSPVIRYRPSPTGSRITRGKFPSRPGGR
jgi:hypothetical protein